MKISEFKNIADSLKPAGRQPVIFLGHGNPMNAITENPYRESWRELGDKLWKPAAVLCISAHWYTRGTFVAMNQRPRTIHDFGGFPRELHEQEYPAPGAPDMAREVIGNVDLTQVKGVIDWGLDHGAWCVLQPMFPDADVPVFQMSIDHEKPAVFHYELGKQLAFLRDKGVLIIGSGNIVHNLFMARPDKASPYSWAVEFDRVAREKLLDKNDAALVSYEKYGVAAQLSAPTNEHYLPLLYALGASAGRQNVEIFNDAFDLASISMTSVIFS